MSEVFASVRERHSIYPDIYVSKAWLGKEQRQVFLKKWLMVGREEDLAAEGDFTCINLMGNDVFLVRSGGTIKAFYNTCPHRGMRLVDGNGNLDVVVCPLHGWRFATDGSLLSHPGVRNGEAAFDPCHFDLKSIRCESLGGFLWINFSESADTLAKQLGSFVEQVLMPYSTQDLVCYNKEENHCRANWKLYLETGMENLHIPFVHETSIGKQVLSAVDAHGEWQCLEMRHQSTASLPEHLHGELDTIVSEGFDATRFCLVYPNLFIVATTDSLWWAQTWPLAPDRCSIRFGFCVHEQSLGNSRFEDVIAPYEHHWRQVIGEDASIIERLQRGIGLASAPFYTRYEKAIARYHAWLQDALDKPLGR